MIAAIVLTMASVQGVEVSQTTPPMFVEGESFNVTIEVKTPATEGGIVPAWLFSPSAYSLNGRPLGRRENDHTVSLAANTNIVVEFDMGPTISEFEGFDKKSFLLSFPFHKEVEPQKILFLAAAEKGIDFMALPLEQLSNYGAILETTQGTIMLEMWGDRAPNHVRNFLDLTYTGFYDGSTFHTVIPQFMIQAGRSRAGSTPPRTLQTEQNSGRHIPGVLSMATVPGEPNSATSEFFIVHSVRPDLDGKYTTFGEVLIGMPVVDLIAHSGNKSYKAEDPKAWVPPVDQVIERAIVVKIPPLFKEEIQNK